QGCPPLGAQGRDGGVQRGDRRLLLRDIERGGGARGALELQSLEDLRGIGEVGFSHAEPVAQLECLKITGGDARHDGELHRGAVVAAGAGDGAGGGESRAIPAPEVELVAGREERTEIVAGELCTTA